MSDSPRSMKGLAKTMAEKGFGGLTSSLLICCLDSSSCCCIFILPFNKPQSKGLWVQLFKGTPPFPAIRRSVSGRSRTTDSTQTPENAARNQNMDLHPKEPASTPPITGPKARLSCRTVDVSQMRCWLGNAQATYRRKTIPNNHLARVEGKCQRLTQPQER